MNILSTLIDIIRRNPLTTVLIVMLIVAAPGVLGVFALFLLIPIISLLIGWIMIQYRVRKVKKSMEEQLRNHAEREGQRTTDSTKREGKVTVHIPPQEQKVSDDVGEYVSFKEIKEDK